MSKHSTGKWDLAKPQAVPDAEFKRVWQLFSFMGFGGNDGVSPPQTGASITIWRVCGVGSA